MIYMGLVQYIVTIIYQIDHNTNKHSQKELPLPETTPNSNTSGTDATDTILVVWSYLTGLPALSMAESEAGEGGKVVVQDARCSPAYNTQYDPPHYRSEINKTWSYNASPTPKET